MPGDVAQAAPEPAPIERNMITVVPETRFDKLDPTELPPIVPMSREQRDYLIPITKAMREVVEQRRPLGESDPFFGKGKFFWPKNPKEPIKTWLSFERSNFAVRSISLGFRRSKADAPWESAVLLVHPRNFPWGVYSMDLPKSFFADLALLKAFSEKRQHGALVAVNVFEFAPRQGDTKIRIRFETRPDLSDLGEKYPRSFHALVVSRNPQEDPQ